MFETLSDKLLIKLFDKQHGIYNLCKIAAPLFSKKKHGNIQSSIDKRSVLQGLLNQHIIPHNLHHIWPFWVYKQMHPTSNHFTANNLASLTINNTHRNWTFLSNPGISDIPKVDPTGLITPFHNGWSIDIWIAQNNQITSPSQLTNVRQSMASDIPIITTQFSVKKLDITSNILFKQSPPENNTVMNHITVHNTSKQTTSFSFIIAIRPYNPEGISPINEIVYLTNNAFIVNNRLGLILKQKPDNIICANFTDGNIIDHFGKWDMILQAKCPMHLASGFAEYRISLPPNESQIFEFNTPTNQLPPLFQLLQTQLLPIHQKKLNKRISTLQHSTYSKEKETLTKYWGTLKHPCLNISLNHPKLDPLITQNTLHLLSINQSQVIKSDDLFYILLSLNRLGSVTTSKIILKTLLKLSQQTSNSEHATIAKLAQIIIGYSDYLNINPKNIPEGKWFQTLEKASNRLWKQWTKLIIKLPKGPIHSDDSILIGTLWTIEAIKSFTKISRLLKRKEKFKKLKHRKNTLVKYLNDITPKLLETPALLKNPHSMHSTSIIDSLIGIYPLNIYQTHFTVVDRILKYIDKYSINQDIYVQSSQLGISPSQNCQLAQVYIKKQNKRCIHILEWLASIATPTGTWPSTINPLTKGGCHQNGHDLRISAEMIHLVRNILIKEDKSTLWITPMVPEDWLTPSSPPLTLSQCPTTFGQTSFTLTRKDNTIHLSLQHKFHKRPRSIHIRLPYNISKMKTTQTEKMINATHAEIPLKASEVTFILSNDTAS